MEGKVTVITGANAGIGKETAVGLAAKGAVTILACRNQEKAATAAQEVKERSGSDRVHVVSLDLGDLSSVRECAATIQDRWDRLDVLVNNAGGIWTERATTTQGFEQTFGVNHLGHFYLTTLLVDRLVRSATSEPSRVVNLSSFGHHLAVGGMRWDDLQTEHGYTAMDAYSHSKLANILFTRALARRFDRAELTANAAHPGPVRSQFGMDGDMKGIMGLGYRVVRPLQISPKAGAKTSIFLATDPSVATKTGGYWARRRPGFMSPAARNDAAVERLWAESEHLVRSVGFDLPSLPLRDAAR